MKHSRTAYHESAHAVVGYNHGFEIKEVSIITDKVNYNGYAKFYVMSSSDFKELPKGKQIIYARMQIHILFAGATSDIYFYGDCNPESVNTDMNRAKNWIEIIAKHTGAKEKDIVSTLSKETKSMVEKYAKDIHTVATILEKKKVIKQLKKNIFGRWVFK